MGDPEGAGHLIQVSVEDLHRHFVTTYQLNADQADHMVARAAQSVCDALQQTQSVLDEHDTQRMAHAAHNLKGVLLNMGRPDYAELARQAEGAAKAGDLAACATVMASLEAGLESLVQYHRNKGGEGE